MHSSILAHNAQNEIESVSYTVLVSSVLPTYVSNHENPYLLKVVMVSK